MRGLKQVYILRVIDTGNPEIPELWKYVKSRNIKVYYDVSLDVTQ